MGSLETFLPKCASKLTRGWKYPQVPPGSLHRVAEEHTTGHLSNGHQAGILSTSFPAFSEPTETLADSPLKAFLFGKIVQREETHYGVHVPYFHTVSCHCQRVPLLGPSFQGQELCHFQIQCECAQGDIRMRCAGLWCCQGACSRRTYQCLSLRSKASHGMALLLSHSGLYLGSEG